MWHLTPVLATVWANRYCSVAGGVFVIGHFAADKGLVVKSWTKGFPLV